MSISVIKITLIRPFWKSFKQIKKLCSDKQVTMRKKSIKISLTKRIYTLYLSGSSADVAQCHSKISKLLKE